VKYHFGSKEGLYEAVAEAVYEKNLSGFLDIAKNVHDAASWQAAIREWISKVIEITGNPDSPRNFVARIVAREFAEPSPLHDKVAKRFYQPLRDEFAKLVRMAVTTDGSSLDDLQTRLWNAAIGAVCFSHAAVRPSWCEIYAPKGVSREEWAKAEVEWMCQLVFAQLKYNG
jgi:AcrR family transcriptional regulator